MDYDHSATGIQGLDASKSHLASGCPITDADRQAVRERRQAMLANGYSPLRVHTPWSLSVAPNNRGKQPVGKAWTEGHSLKRLMRVTPLSANTGVVLGALVALDLDPNKRATAAEQLQFSLDILRFLHGIRPELRTAPLRLRSPGSVLALLHADRPMTKIVVAGERGKVELLAEGQQCLVHGWHPLSYAGTLVKWEWINDRSPWTVPVGELPVVSAADLTTLMDRIRASGVLGAPVARGATTTTIVGRRGRASAYPATERLNELFRQHNGFVRPAVRELITEVGKAGEGRHDAVVAVCGRLVHQDWPYQEAVDWLTPLVNEHFQDGDWTEEIERALSHALGKEKARLSKVKSIVWRNSNI
jgi:hypothetical protein